MSSQRRFRTRSHMSAATPRRAVHLSRLTTLGTKCRDAVHHSQRLTTSGQLSRTPSTYYVGAPIVTHPSTYYVWATDCHARLPLARRPLSPSRLVLRCDRRPPLRPAPASLAAPTCVTFPTHIIPPHFTQQQHAQLPPRIQRATPPLRAVIGLTVDLPPYRI